MNSLFGLLYATRKGLFLGIDKARSCDLEPSSPLSGATGCNRLQLARSLGGGLHALLAILRDEPLAHGDRAPHHGRNHALPTWKYTALVPGLCAKSIPACRPNLRASS